MRKPLLMAAALLISAVAFGQKKELKEELEKFIKSRQEVVAPDEE